jgi:DNA replication protein DnaC
MKTGMSFKAQTSQTPAFGGNDIVIPATVTESVTCAHCNTPFPAEKRGGKIIVEWDLYDGRRCCSHGCYITLRGVDKKNTIDSDKQSMINNPNHYLGLAGVGSDLINASFDNFSSDTNPVTRFRMGDDTLLVISGEISGVGKSHLAVALLRESVLDGKTTSMMFTTVRGIQEKMSSMIHARKDIFKLQRYLQNLDTLIIDDLGSEKTTDAVSALLYEVISHRYSERKRLIVTTNLTNDELVRTYGQRIFSRLSSGLCFSLMGKDFRRG